jgi:nucleoside-specific outer membrane channel protein Tsx
MRFSPLLAILLVLTSVAVAQPVGHVPPSKGKPAAGWSSLPPDARRAIRAALEENAPGWTQQAELTASDGAAGSNFGISVAVDGSTAVVGARTNGPNSSQGAAYVFVESGGTWSQQAELTASDGATDDQFGQSVAVSGSTIVVGAPQHPFSLAGNGPGKAYVFVENGGTWSQQAELTASDGAAGDNFGHSVAVSGSTAVVGAAGHTVGSNQGQGASYVFTPSGGTWSQQAELTSSDGAANDEFGNSVAVSGNTAVVGAPGHMIGSNGYQGAAYVFVQSGTTWSQQAELTSSDGAANDGFGDSVAVSGSTAVVGAPDHGIGLNVDQGAAYVFAQSGTAWNQQAELTAADGAAGDYLGNSVAVSDSTALAGTWLHTVGSNVEQGAAYVFVPSGGSWSQQAELTAADGARHDGFGVSVAVSGSTALAGALNHEVGSNPAQGAAYVFSSSPPGFTLSANPSNLSVMQGGQGMSTITIAPANGFDGSVSFSASGLPSGVTAAFSPDPATSASTLTLTASGTATAGTVTVTVTGTSGSLTQITSLTLTVIPTTTVALLPTSLNFGKEAINNTSGAKTVTVRNTGNATLALSSITASADFAVSSTTCKATLAVGKTCGVKVTFTPTQLGAVTGTLSFTDNTLNSPQTVALSGEGVEPATLTPTSATYGKQVVGRTSAAKTFTLTNNQTVELTSIGISTTGDFAVSAATCGTSLAAKAKCTISVTFTPTQTGTRTGQLIVNDNAGNSPQTSNLMGTGE